VRLAIVPAGNAVVELAQPLTQDQGLATFIAEHGGGMYSLSIEVDDLDAAVAELRGRGVKVSDSEVGLLEGTRVARIDPRSAHGVALQLIERG
jgi:methylmalonyl-CoA/ethylmalonyl-CoA epimerase